ncbi:MAG: RNA-binding transcriptional accessory protein [Ruminococcaceae bacterium]|nr:RNA-binding transcriptional accessory protein [Oscillospiraceae bacterium]
MDIILQLAQELNLKREQVEKTVALLDEGNTVPFIARYRKEVTGSLDDTVLRTLSERLDYLRSLDRRREEVYSAILAQEKMTPEIEAALSAAKILTEIEDIYRPFKQKRRTRASVARERGLEPLAQALIEQKTWYEPSIADLAASFVDEEKGVPTAEDALAGACDIIAEDISDNAEYRKELRRLTYRDGILKTVGTKDEDSVYSMYYDRTERVNRIPDHRILAINRGEKEEYLRVSLITEGDAPTAYLMSQVIKNDRSPAKDYLTATVLDAWSRLIAPSIENEIRAQLFDRASEGAISNFSLNLKHLLMGAPLRNFTVMGYDPGYRTGCKLAVVDETGRVLDTAVIYPTKPQERIAESKRTVKHLVKKYDVGAIAIGNGTASKESEIFIAETLSELSAEHVFCKYIVVSEAGASVYSASKLGAEEFPDFDVTQRSAVSIARRLQDPLAELVKIDPKSIGVGQYQHDMKEARLDEALSGVVEDCVNAVGVDINTASYSLLSYIAGINTTSAKNIVKYREENGAFTSRAQIKKVPRIGAKAFEQCAGFLRIPDAKEILDNTGVHPESYDAAKALLDRFGFTAADVRGGGLTELRAKAEAAGMDALAQSLGIGTPTLTDIIAELEKPGRDIRDGLPKPQLRSDILSMEDLVPGMVLTGTVRNVIDFGAFVDIGVHQDGLVHISQLGSKFVRHPSEVLAVGDVVEVRVLDVDVKKKRIALTMKK